MREEAFVPPTATHTLKGSVSAEGTPSFCQRKHPLTFNISYCFSSTQFAFCRINTEQSNWTTVNNPKWGEGGGYREFKFPGPS